MSIEAIHKNIIEEFVAANITFDPSRFLPHLMSEHVVVCELWKKEDFYDFFSKMLCCAQEHALGDLYPVIFKPDLNDNIYQYHFRDQNHLFSLITFDLEYLGDTIFFDIHPF